MEQGARIKLTTVLLLALVFASGVLLGMAADRSLEAEPADGTEEVAEERRERRGGQMWEQVGPDEEQSILIEAIVKDFREGMKSLQAEFRAAYYPRYDALIEDTREAIKGVLTPAQAAAYDSLVAEWESRREERGSRERRD